MAAVDAVTAQVIQATLAGIVQEMQNSLFRTGFSTIIRESQDASCAILSPDGRLGAQHVVLPLHIGAFPACLAGILDAYPLAAMAEGDAFLVNDPYRGGSPHAPDIAVITPCFHRGRPIGFLGSIAHKGDLGGPVPGSCSGQAREVFNEGLQIPPLRYARAGVPSREVESLIAANSRTPELVLGDIRGQLGCARLGERRLAALADKYGPDALAETMDVQRAATGRRLRRAIAEWPDGTAAAERELDDDGVELGCPVPVRVRVEKRGESLRFDLRESADQTRGPANIRPPIVRAGCAYVLIALTDPTQPVNGGLFDAFEVLTRPGSVCDPHFPAAVNTYNPTVHCLVDACFEAMSRLLPHRRRADGCGSRSVFFGGSFAAPGGDARRYVQYELFGGGSGGRTGLDGVSGVQVNQSNGRIASIEVIESEFPTRVRRFELIPDSGGPGRFRGGLGFRRVYENLAPESRFSIRSTKHVIPALGLDGGGPGRPGACVANPGLTGERTLPARYADLPLGPAEVILLETPGGGGLGDPRSRPPDRVLDDVREGYVTPEGARRDYAVSIRRGEGGAWEVDAEATAALRGAAGGPA